MAVVTVATATVKPDRMEDFLQDMRKAKAITERCGGKNVRVLTAVVAGEATGTVAFMTESDDFAASGAAMDKFYADPDALALTSSMSGTAGTLAGAAQTTQWVDIPL